MVRSIVVALGLLSGAGCSKADRQPPAQVEKPAGRVVEVLGKVFATRGTTTPRVLVVGDEVFRDDTIDPGSDGSITVDLYHNNARWSVEGRLARVDDSQAWRLARQEPVQPVDHATSSAGRDAERQGAGTRVTAEPAAPVATGGGADKGTNRGGQRNEQDRVTAAESTPAPPTAPLAPKAPAPPEPVITRDVPTAEPTPRNARTLDAPSAKVRSSVEAKRAELRACVSPTTVVKITIALVKGVPKIAVEGITDVKARTCVEDIVKGLTFPAADLETTIVVN
ncbi:MAG: hypothetical protein WKG01_42300 [Kofleriaceae bacterium]